VRDNTGTGYSLAFSEGNAVYGGSSRFWLSNIELDKGHPIAPHIPEALFVAYELMFAIITPALICGAFADRMRLIPMLLFMALWVNRIPH
jgi:Amt family ammonium transporter